LAGELLHTPERMPTFMATVMLSIADDILCGILVSQQWDTATMLSDHPASPVLLTSNGPRGASTILGHGCAVKNAFPFPFVWQGGYNLAQLLACKSASSEAPGAPLQFDDRQRPVERFPKPSIGALRRKTVPHSTRSRDHDQTHPWRDYMRLQRS